LEPERFRGFIGEVLTGGTTTDQCAALVQLTAELRG